MDVPEGWGEGRDETGKKKRALEEGEDGGGGAGKAGQGGSRSQNRARGLWNPWGLWTPPRDLWTPWPWSPPKEPQYGPQAPKRAPRGPQESSNMTPRGPQESPKMATRCFREPLTTTLQLAWVSLMVAGGDTRNVKIFNASSGQTNGGGQESATAPSDSGPSWPGPLSQSPQSSSLELFLFL